MHAIIYSQQLVAAANAMVHCITMQVAAQIVQIYKYGNYCYSSKQQSNTAVKLSEFIEKKRVKEPRRATRDDMRKSST